MEEEEEAAEDAGDAEDASAPPALPAGAPAAAPPHSRKQGWEVRSSSACSSSRARSWASIAARLRERAVGTIVSVRRVLEEVRAENNRWSFIWIQEIGLRKPIL